MSLSQIAWDDTVLPFQLDNADIRGRIAAGASPGWMAFLTLCWGSTITPIKLNRWWPRLFC